MALCKLLAFFFSTVTTNNMLCSVLDFSWYPVIGGGEEEFVIACRRFWYASGSSHAM